jgi:hypothetical protein
MRVSVNVPQPANPPAYLAWGVLLLVLVLTALVRIRLLDVPLERDEGEYAYAGQLMLQGTPPYKLAYNMKPPGIYATYAVVLALFGQTPRGVHLGLLFVNTGTIALVFLLGRRLVGVTAGLFAAGAYALLSVSPSVLGPFAHASHFIVLAALAGLFLLLRALDSGRQQGFFFAGTLFGVAILMKQHAVFFLGFGAAYLGWVQFTRRDGTLRRAALQWVSFTAGVATPLLVTCLALLTAGTFERFWFWTIRYAREYVTEIGPAEAARIFPDALKMAVGPSVLLWVLAAAGVVALVLDRTVRPRATFLFLFTLFSFLAVCPGFYFREHYFIVMLPVVALLAGIAATSAGRLFWRGKERVLGSATALILFALAGGYQLHAQRVFLLGLSPIQASREAYGANPFPESVEVGRYIKERSDPDDAIAVLGSEPQIYFYSGRRSATGYIYTYGLMEPQKYASRMQDEMIREIESARPKFVVFVNVSASWLVRENSDRRILKWAERYLDENYMLVGVVDIVAKDRTEYRWDADAANYQNQSQSYLMVFRRSESITP